MNFEEILRDTFDDVEDLSMDKIDRLTTESMAFFTVLKGKMESADPKAKEEAQQEMLEIKQYLEKRLQELAEETGFDFLQFDPSVLTDQQKDMVAEITAKISNMNHTSSNKNKKIRVV